MMSALGQSPGKAWLGIFKDNDQLRQTITECTSDIGTPRDQTSRVILHAIFVGKLLNSSMEKATASSADSACTGNTEGSPLNQRKTWVASSSRPARIRAALNGHWVDSDHSSQASSSC
jgi:hypothetical protein